MKVTYFTCYVLMIFNLFLAYLISTYVSEKHGALQFFKLNTWAGILLSSGEWDIKIQRENETA